MAYPVTEETRELFLSARKQVADIVFNGTNESLNLTEKDILSGGLSINRYSVSGNRIEIGSVIASELTLILDNSDKKFTHTTFEGAELFVRIGVADEVDNQYIPFGYFTIDEVPRKLQSISITALDRMVMFDKTVDISVLSFPCTVGELLIRICDICNVPLGIDTTQLCNSEYVVNAEPIADNPTYRQYLSWIAEITGTCGFMNWEGQLVLKWYERTDVRIAPKDRYSSDLLENAVTISGIQITNDTDVFLVGDDSYVLNIESNRLIQHDHREVAEELFSALNGFSYVPFSATVNPMPYLYPMDIILFADKENTVHETIITNYTFTINHNTYLEGKGESTTKSGYSTINPLTKRESVIIKTIAQEQNKTLNDRVQSVLEFNELISNALGLYVTPVAQKDGSTIYYIHDTHNLEESIVIFTMTAGGIAWTNSGWNHGEPVWSYGASSAGNALFRMLSAEGLEISKVGEDYNIEITPTAFRIYYKEMLVTEIEADEMRIPKANFTAHAECGKIRIVPYTSNNKLVGTNIIFVD